MWTFKNFKKNLESEFQFQKQLQPYTRFEIRAICEVAGTFLIGMKIPQDWV